MPWTTDDVDRFKKGLDEKGKKRWVAIANGALADCMKQENADEIDCEVKAVRIANATVDGAKKEAALALADRPNPLMVEDHESTINVALAETAEDGEYQLAFPIGLFRTSKYGEMIVTRTFAERMVQNWKGKILGERAVFMDTDHDFGEANAWARDMRVTADGLEIAWDFNAKGRELIADQRYRYYSAAIGWATDTETGEEHFPVLHAVSLTNAPVMNRMPEAHLSEQGNQPAHGDGGNDNEEESMNTLVEVLTALFALSDDEREKVTDEDRAKLAQVLGIELADSTEIDQLKGKIAADEAKLNTLLSENRELNESLTQFRDAEKTAKRDKVIEAALADGKIIGKNRAQWEALYDADPEGTEKVLSEKGKEIDFDQHGTGDSGVALSDDERKAADAAGIPPEEYRKTMQEVYGDEEAE